MNIFNPKLKFQTWLFPMQFACFDCRKVFKRVIDYDRYKDTQICPQCAEKMFLMGRTFKAPKQNNIKQWKKVEHLIRNGFVFYSGARPYGNLLKTLRDAKVFIENRRAKPIVKKREKTLFKRER